MHCVPWLAKNDKNTLNTAKAERDSATQTQLEQYKIRIVLPGFARC